MKKNLKEITLFSLTAVLFCMSAQTVSTDDLVYREESQEISMNSCKEPSKEKQDCKMDEKACAKKKGDSTPRKSAARRVIEGS
jgi:hypothetical protein